jgi:hypothetical protein
MKSTLVALSAILALAVLLALGWLLAGNNLAMQSVFAPKQEQVRRETFEQSKAFRDGVVNDLRDMQFEYVKADESRKKPLAYIIKAKADEIDRTVLPADLQAFLTTLP